MSQTSRLTKDLPIHRQYLTIGVGQIGPEAHVKDGDYNWELVDSLETDLIYDATLYETVTMDIPVQCADGRTRRANGASAIGGSFSMVIADALGPRCYYSAEITAKQQSLDIYKVFLGLGLSIGGHVDDMASGNNCGCGGEDKLGSNDPNAMTILKFIAEHGDQIKQQIKALKDSKNGQPLNIKIDEQMHKLIVANARELNVRSCGANPYVTNGKDLRDAFIEAQNENVIEMLHGPHKETVALLDLRETNLVLNRAKLSEVFEDEIQAFYVNIMSLKTASELLYDQIENAQLAYVAALYYNVAATAVLSAPSLRLLTLT